MGERRSAKLVCGAIDCRIPAGINNQYFKATKVHPAPQDNYMTKLHLLQRGDEWPKAGLNYIEN